MLMVQSVAEPLSVIFASGTSTWFDEVAVIVSEQTGRISLAYKGAIQQDLDEKALRRALEDIAAAPPDEQ